MAATQRVFGLEIPCSESITVAEMYAALAECGTDKRWLCPCVHGTKGEATCIDQPQLGSLQGYVPTSHVLNRYVTGGQKLLTRLGLAAVLVSGHQAGSHVLSSTDSHCRVAFFTRHWPTQTVQVWVFDPLQESLSKQAIPRLVCHLAHKIPKVEQGWITYGDQGEDDCSCVARCLAFVQTVDSHLCALLDKENRGEEALCMAAQWSARSKSDIMKHAK